MKEKLLNLTDNSHYEGVYDEKDGRTEMQWGKYDYGVSRDCQEPDYMMLTDACKKFNTESNTHYAIAEYSDKYNIITLYTYKALSEHDSAYEKVMKGNKEVAAKVKLAGFSNQKIDDKIDAELKALKAKLKIIKALSKEVGFNLLEKNYDSLMNLFSSTIRRYKFSIKFDDNSFVKEFDTIEELFDVLKSDKVVGYLSKHSAWKHKVLAYIGHDYLELISYGHEKDKDFYIQYVNFGKIVDSPSECKWAIETYIKMYNSTCKRLKYKMK